MTDPINQPQDTTAPSRPNGFVRVANPFGEPALKLSILMPVYNEERTIRCAIDEILKTDYQCDIELIVVDDGSTDRTEAILTHVKDNRVAVHRHPVNRGKGAALLTALSLASGTHVVPFDADLEYCAADLPRILEPVLTRRCSVVYGARLFGCNTVYQSYRYALGNRVLTRMANLLFNAYITDLHTCLKLIPSEMLKALRLKEAGFGLDTEITAALLKLGIRPFEVPVSYYGRTHSQGKKINWRDAVACARILLQVRFRRRPGEHAAGAANNRTWPARPCLRRRPDDLRVFANDDVNGHRRALRTSPDAIPVPFPVGGGEDSLEQGR